MMVIPGPVNLVDCFVFILLVVWHLLRLHGLAAACNVVAKTAPFLLWRLPRTLWQTRRRHRSGVFNPYGTRVPLFYDVVVRCVRFALAELPARVLRLFFMPEVARAFFSWRNWRCSSQSFQPSIEEVTLAQQANGHGTKGLWITQGYGKPPDIVVYYIHGGGFALGSPYFYQEFLVAYHGMLLEAGYRYPAVLAVEYSLVPERIFPRQLHQVIEGYKFAVKSAGTPSRVCLSGDSAGGTLALSLLLERGEAMMNRRRNSKMYIVRGRPTRQKELPRSIFAHPPQLAVLISPWVTLQSRLLHRDSEADYLSRKAVWEYARQYMDGLGVDDPYLQRCPASPGSCGCLNIWKRSVPKKGVFVIYGRDEIFADDIRAFVSRLRSETNAEIEAVESSMGCHAWAVASLFLASTSIQRFEGCCGPKFYR